MKPLTISFLAMLTLTIGACSVSKKSSPAAPTVEQAPPATAAPRIAPSITSSDGIFAPGNAELAALQLRHKEVTMPTLAEGYKLYIGVCANCHAPKSIYDRPEDAWPGILTNMAKEAKITDAQKDAIYKYVMAIKATQPPRLLLWGK